MKYLLIGLLARTEPSSSAPSQLCDFRNINQPFWPHFPPLWNEQFLDLYPIPKGTHLCASGGKPSPPQLNPSHKYFIAQLAENTSWQKPALKHLHFPHNEDWKWLHKNKTKWGSQNICNSPFQRGSSSTGIKADTINRWDDSRFSHSPPVPLQRLALDQL